MKSQTNSVKPAQPLPQKKVLPGITKESLERAKAEFIAEHGDLTLDQIADMQEAAFQARVEAKYGKK